MVGLGASTKGSVQALDYILDDKGKAIELDRNLVSGTNGTELLNEFRFVQQFNRNCTNNTFSFVLSPAPDRQYSLDELRTYANEFLQEMKLHDNQWIATVHRSTKTNHIHIQCNRIDKRGKALNDFRIGKKTQRAAQKVAEKHGLTTSKSIREKKNADNKLKRDEYRQIYLRETQTAKSFYQFQTDIKKYGIEVVKMKNKQGETQGLRFMTPEEKTQFEDREYSKGHKKGEIPGIKASDIGKELSFKQMKMRGVSFDQVKLTKTQEKNIFNTPYNSINEADPRRKRKQKQNKI